jgi:hypothetical protein
MAGYPTPPGDSLEPIIAKIRDLQRQLTELARPSGTSIGSLVDQVQAKLADLETTVIAATDSYLSSGTVNMTNISASGSVSAASFSATGAVSGSTGTFNSGVKSVDVYNRLVSGSPYKVQYVDSSGQMGYVPSSRRYKQNIVTAKLDVRSIMAKLRVVTFRYLGAVELSGKEAAVEWGVIAEEIHDLGLTWLVDYTEDGLPDGVKHERFAILLIMAAQEQQSQIDDLSERLSAIGG